jgi:DNA-binding SARP family transcriptional activator
MNEWPEKDDPGSTANQTVPIRLGLLGTFSLAFGDDREMEISSRKNRALLAILALAPGHQATRERLCGLFWSDRGEEQARSSLRQSLAVLRKELAEADNLLLQTHDDVVALRPAAISIEAVEIAKLSAAIDVESVRRGAALWRGELLADTSIKDQGFEDWLSASYSI